jgi:hypothetical protein
MVNRTALPAVNFAREEIRTRLVLLYDLKNKIYTTFLWLRQFKYVVSI